jgi:hypothetical protein
MEVLKNSRVLQALAAAKVALPGLTPFAARPESTVILPVIAGTSYRSLGSILSGTNVPAKAFAPSSLGFSAIEISSTT